MLVPPLLVYVCLVRGFYPLTTLCFNFFILGLIPFVITNKLLAFSVPGSFLDQNHYLLEMPCIKYELNYVGGEVKVCIG